MPFQYFGGRYKKDSKNFQRNNPLYAADPVVANMDLNELKKFIIGTRKKMEKAAQDLILWKRLS